MAAPFIQRLCPRLLGQSMSHSSFFGTIQSKPLQTYSRYFSSKSSRFFPKFRRGLHRFATVGTTIVVLGTGSALAYYLQFQRVNAEDSLFEDQERPFFKPSREVKYHHFGNVLLSRVIALTLCDTGPNSA